MTIAKTETLVIQAPKLETAEFIIISTAPYVMAKFSNKAKQQMRDKHEAGSTAKKTKRDARDFHQDFLESQHVAMEGWNGFHAGGLRQAFISACRLVNFKMTLAKMSIFVLADGFDRDEGTPLIRLYGDPAQQVEHMVRNATGVADIRVRAMFRNWYSKIRVRYDADQFKSQDIANLLMRVGEQVGLGEGRPDSKASAGMGWGTFRIADADEAAQLEF